MPVTRSTRKISAPAQELWEVVRDPYHLPRWWPRVARVESVEEDVFTEVLHTRKGRSVRADFRLTDLDEEARRLTWSQQLQGTPFESMMSSAETTLELQALDGGASCEVMIELHQELLRNAPGGVMRQYTYWPRLGSFLVSRANRATLKEALDGLERISG